MLFDVRLSAFPTYTTQFNFLKGTHAICVIPKAATGTFTAGTAVYHSNLESTLLAVHHLCDSLNIHRMLYVEYYTFEYYTPNTMREILYVEYYTSNNIRRTQILISSKNYKTSI